MRDCSAALPGEEMLEGEEGRGRRGGRGGREGRVRRRKVYINAQLLPGNLPKQCLKKKMKKNQVRAN